MARVPIPNALRPLAALALSVLIVLVSATTPAAAVMATDAPENDSGNCVPNGRNGWICEGKEDGSPGGSPTEGTTPVNGSEPVCREGAREVPCKDSRGGLWNGECYASVVAPPPAKTDRIWEGHDNGVIMTCVLRIEACDQSAGIHLPPEDCILRWWAPSAEGAIDVEQIAREAFAEANPTKIPIGIVPENQPGRVGLVGMPVWMWVQEPGTQTVGPLTATAPAGGATVTSTGRVARIDWNMGDGTTVTCQGAGTPYQDSFGKKESPDCGHRYEKQGNPYTVTATSHWVVDWHGAGQSGTFTLDLTSETQIVVGEAHVITQ